MLPAWLWTRMAHAVTICPSHDAPLSIGMGRNCKDLIKSEKYQAAFPEIKIRRDVDANGHFGNTLGGERIAASVNGNIMGKHAHLILTDDPINPKKAASEVELKAINTWMEETLPSRVKDIKKTPKVLIMQRLHQKDPAQKTLDRGGVRHICLPAELSDKVKPKKLRRKYVNGLLDPIRFDPEALKKQKNILSQYAYACQYDQNPIPRAGGMFKVERMVVDTPHKKFIRQVRYWDKAGKADAGCFTVGFKLGEDEDGVLWIKHIVRGQWSALQREEIMKQTAKSDGLRVVIGVEQEGGSGGLESAENTVRNLKGFIVKIDSPRGDKELRADAFATQVEKGNVRIEEGDWLYVLVGEKTLLEIVLDVFRYFPYGVVKDDVDASSGAMAVLTKLKYRRVIGAL